MSGVEIEFSAEDGGIGTQDDDGGAGTEGGDSRTQANTTTGGPSRIQGKWQCDLFRKLLNLIDSPNSDPAAFGACRSSPDICQPSGRRLWHHIAAR